jgi:hypothetical protein
MFVVGTLQLLKLSQKILHPCPRAGAETSLTNALLLGEFLWVGQTWSVRIGQTFDGGFPKSSVGGSSTFLRPKHPDSFWLSLDFGSLN